MQQREVGLLSKFWSNGAKPAPSGRTIRYKLSFEDPFGHYLRVKLELEDVVAGQQFSLPVWIPGSYMVRDFAKHVISIQAEAGGAPVEIVMQDKSTWVVKQDCDQLSLSLLIYAFDDSVRAAWFDEQRAFVNGTSVFPRVVGREDWACELEMAKPEHHALQSWRLATGLDVVDAPAWGFGCFVADDYDALVDCPIEAGDFDLHEFEACGVPHVVLLSGNNQAVAMNEKRLCADLQNICEKHIQRFEPETARAPFSRYLFITYVTENGYGGLEHRNSTALVVAERDLPTGSDDKKATPEYQQFLGLCSHEYFHSWNVKRIVPQAFRQPDYQQENYSTQLWAFEGITSYFDDLGVLQAGCISPQDWLASVGQIMTRVWRGSGRHGQSLSDSSFTTWTRFYQQDANAPNAIVSYYAKGAVMALCIDLKLRLLTNGSSSLEQVMRLLWQQYGRERAGVPENGIEQLILSQLQEFSQDAQDDMRDFMESGLRGTQDLPVDELLAEFGVQLSWRAASSAKDKGGTADESTWRVWSGFVGKQVGTEVELMRVDNNSPAHKAGLSLKDRIAAVNGYRVSMEWLEEQLRDGAPGETWELTVFRGNKELRKRLSLEPAPKTTAVLSLLDGCEPHIQSRRQEWLGC